MLNKVFLIGNLGQDPEVRHTTGGQPVANLRLATSRKFKDKDGTWQEQTEWHSVVCFGFSAERVGQHGRKGSRIFVEGRLQTRSWDDREGKKQYRTEVVADVLRMLDSRGGGGEEGGFGGGGVQADGGRSSGGNEGGGSFPDEDIPF